MQHQGILPKSYEGDSRLRGFYCLLPIKLLQLFQRDHKLLEMLDKRSLQMDIELTNSSNDLRRAIGFHNEIPFQYHLLVPKLETLIPTELAKEWGVDRDQLNRTLQKGEISLQAANAEARAYNGWLLSNPDFLSQYRILVGEGQQWLEHEGFPKMWPNLAGRSDFSKPIHDPIKQTWVAQWLSFSTHWQLRGMAGPLLPLPLQRLEMPVPESLNPNIYDRTAGTISIPAITSTPKGDDLRRTIEAISGRKRARAHLRPWMEIVEDANQQRGVQIEAYERRFRLAHFWRVFHDRYGDQVQGRGIRSRVVDVFAEFLDVERQVIDRSLTLLKAKNLFIT